MDNPRLAPTTLPVTQPVSPTPTFSQIHASSFRLEAEGPHTPDLNGISLSQRYAQVVQDSQSSTPTTRRWPDPEHVMPATNVKQPHSVRLLLILRCPPSSLSFSARLDHLSAPSPMHHPSSPSIPQRASLTEAAPMMCPRHCRTWHRPLRTTG